MKKLSIFYSDRFLFQEKPRDNGDGGKSQQVPEENEGHERSYLERMKVSPELQDAMAKFLSDPAILSAIPKKSDKWVYDKDGVKIVAKIVYEGMSAVGFNVSFSGLGDDLNAIPTVFCDLRGKQWTVGFDGDIRVINALLDVSIMPGVHDLDGEKLNVKNDALVRKFVTLFLQRNWRSYVERVEDDRHIFD